MPPIVNTESSYCLQVSASFSCLSLADILCSRLCKNKFFGSAFNINTAAMMILTGVTVPVSAATNLSLLAGLEEEERRLACILRPSILWVWAGSTFISAFLSVLFK